MVLYLGSLLSNLIFNLFEFFILYLGALVTTSIAYYTASEFRRNGQFAASQLEEARIILDNYGKEKPFVPRKIERESRDDIIETAKDLWNHEIIRGVNWFYGIQWNTIGKKAENGIETLAKYVKDSTS